MFGIAAMVNATICPGKLATLNGLQRNKRGHYCKRVHLVVSGSSKRATVCVYMHTTHAYHSPCLLLL